MNRIKNKYFLLFIQALLIAGSAYLLYSKLAQDELVDQFYISLKRFEWWHALVILLLSASNWLFDTQTWRFIVLPFYKMSFASALRINLIAQSAGAMTPLSAGDYGLRSFLLKDKIEGWQNALLSWAYRLVKMAMRVMIGFLCIFYTMISKDLFLLGALLTLILMFASGMSIRGMISWVSKTKSANRVLGDKERIDFSNLRFKRVLMPAVLVFMAFSLETTFLIYWMSDSTSLLDVLIWVVITYSITSFLPTTGIFDPLIKSAFGALFAQQLVASPAVILFGFTITWCVNLGIPGLISSLLFRKLIGKFYRTSTSTMNPS